MLADSLNYGANHGLDLAFKQGADDSLRCAMAEAKYGKGLGSLAHDVKGLRQGSWDYIEDRLRLLALRDAQGRETAKILRTARRNNALESFGGFYRGDKLYKLDFNQALLADGTYQKYRFMNIQGAAVLQ